MKERRERGVAGRPGMLREDKVPARQRSPSPHPEAGFISWAQQDRRLGFVPQKQVSLTGFTACCYMPSPICATVCESFLSHTLYLWLPVPIQFLSLLFSLIFLNSDSSEWSRRRQGWVSNLNTFWVQTAIWQCGLGQILVYLFSHQLSTSGGNTSEVCLISLKEKQAFADCLANWVIE